MKTGVISAAIALVEVERGEEADRRGADRELRWCEVRLNRAALLSMSQCQLEVGSLLLRRKVEVFLFLGRGVFFILSGTSLVSYVGAEGKVIGVWVSRLGPGSEAGNLPVNPAEGYVLLLYD